MKTTNTPKTQAAPKLEVTMDTPLAIKRMNAQVIRVQEAHERLSCFLAGYDKMLALGNAEYAKSYIDMLRSEAAFITQIGHVLEAELVSATDLTLAGLVAKG